MSKPNRRDFLQTAGALLSSVMGVNPVQALEAASALATASPTQALLGLLKLQKNLIQLHQVVHGNFLDLFDLSDVIAPSGNTHDERVLNFLATEKDDRLVHQKIVDAYLKYYQLMAARSEYGNEINDQINGLLAGDSDFAVKLRETSRIVGRDVLNTLITVKEEGLAHSLAFVKRNPDPQALQWTEKENAACRERMRRLLAQCPENPTPQELHDAYFKLYEKKYFHVIDFQGEDLWEAIRRTLEKGTAHYGAELPNHNGVYEIDHLVDRMVDETLSDKLLPDAIEEIRTWMKQGDFWKTAFDARSYDRANHSVGDCIEQILNSAASQADYRIQKLANTSKEIYPTIKQRFFDDWRKEYKLRKNLLTDLAEHPKLPEQLRSRLQAQARYVEDEITLAEQHHHDMESWEKDKEKSSQTEQPVQTGRGALSEDTLTALDAMRRPGEFGREKSWFEKLHHDRQTDTPGKKPKRP